MKTHLMTAAIALLAVAVATRIPKIKTVLLNA